MKRKTDSFTGSRPVFTGSPSIVPGGFNLDVTNQSFNVGDIIPIGSVATFNEQTRLVQILKTAEVVEIDSDDAKKVSLKVAEFFKPITAIHRHLKTLVDVGLGYVRLGQPAPTLSGGEAQRVKLASELQKRSTGQTVYILDEPTTGLHFEDIRKLLGVVNGLVDKGNTVIVIEHNLDVIKTADWIVDLGPEGGAGGGTVVAEGTPEEVAEVAESYTGQFLRPVLADR